MHLVLPLVLVCVFLASSSSATWTESFVTKDVLPCFNRTSGTAGHQVKTTVCANVVHDNNNKYTWMGAEKHCQDNDGHLISITNDAEDNAIYDVVKSLVSRSSASGCWIGLFDIGSSSTSDRHWAWIDGESSNYTHWKSSEPNRVNECCTKMYGYSNDWDDVYCHEQFHCFICEQVTVEYSTTSTTTTATTATSSTSTIASSSTTSPTADSSQQTTDITSSTLATPLPIPTQVTTGHKTTGRPSEDSIFISTGGDVALILLSSLFFLTTVGLIIFIHRVKCIHFFKHNTFDHKKEVRKDTYGVSNDAYGAATAPQPSVPVVYYDIQNETAEAQGITVNEPNSHKNGQYDPMEDQDNVAQRDFSDNKLYG